MDSSIKDRQSFSYKDLLLWKLSCAATCNLISQCLSLVLYVILMQFDLMCPTNWPTSILHAFSSIKTFIIILLFMVTVFIQSLICAKDYIMKSKFYSSRFQKFISFISVHLLVLLILHTIFAGVLIWVFLSIAGVSYSNLIENEGLSYYLNEGTFFLVLSGFWNGLYFFIKYYPTEKKIYFPVICQRKFLYFKSRLTSIICKSMSQSLIPCLSYSCVYWLQGNMMADIFRNFFSLSEYNVKPNLSIYLYLFFFGSLYYFNMNLMKFCFDLFLTQPVQFPIEKTSSTNLTLQESLTNSDWPIVQSLACYDLYNIGLWSPTRRKLFYLISNPGGHPHSWNSLIENVLKLFTQYTELINKVIKASEIDVSECRLFTKDCSPAKCAMFRKFPSNVYHSEYNDVVEINQIQPTNAINKISNNISKKIVEKWRKFYNLLTFILGINYLFDKLPQADLQKCLDNTQHVVWASEGLAAIVVASLTEDQYGIVQKDVAKILTILVQLLQNLDKLSKTASAFHKSGGYEKIGDVTKGAMHSAIKRSLFSISSAFRPYFTDISLNKDIEQYIDRQILRIC